MATSEGTDQGAPTSAGEDDGQRYANEVSAPLSPEVIAALRAQLESGEYARYHSPRRGEQEK